MKKDHTSLSITRQCKLLDLKRATYYYRPKEENPFNQELMRLIDEQFLDTLFTGQAK